MVPHPCGGWQDDHHEDSLCSPGGHPSTDRGVQAIPGTRERAGANQRTALQRSIGAGGGRFEGGGKKRGFTEAFATEILSEIEALVGTPVEQWDFEAIEVAARRAALRVACMAVARRLNADGSDHCAISLPCPRCGGPARYAGRRDKAFTTVLGEMRLGRAYYYCEQCTAGFCPRDRQLGFRDGSLSPHVLRMVGIVGARVSFQEGHQLLADLAGIRVATKHIEREAEQLGAEILQEEKLVVEADSNAQLPATLYLGLDGTGVPMRASELVDRRGKQEDGSAKTREVKLVTVWSAQGRDEEGMPMRDEGSVTYSAAIESAASRDTDKELSEFAQRVEREALRRRFQQAPRQAVIGDGAPWIWNIASELFPEALQIVDRYHANERLSTVGKALYGPGTDLAEHWTHQRCTELKAGKLDAVLAALSSHFSIKEARECKRYLQTNRHRMRYDKFHAAGLCTSSAVVESGCKQAVGLRLKQGGMFWTLRGANAILALRCCRLSGRFEDFWERRALRPTG